MTPYLVPTDSCLVSCSLKVITSIQVQDEDCHTMGLALKKTSWVHTCTQKREKGKDRIHISIIKCVCIYTIPVLASHIDLALKQ